MCVCTSERLTKPSENWVSTYVTRLPSQYPNIAEKGNKIALHSKKAGLPVLYVLKFESYKRSSENWESIKTSQRNSERIQTMQKDAVVTAKVNGLHGLYQMCPSFHDVLLLVQLLNVSQLKNNLVLLSIITVIWCMTNLTNVFSFRITSYFILCFSHTSWWI